MTNDEIAEQLRASMKGAKSGPWITSYDSSGPPDSPQIYGFLCEADEAPFLVDEEPELQTDGPPSPTLEYIALCSPDNIKSLLDERAALLDENERLRMAAIRTRAALRGDY